MGLPTDHIYRYIPNNWKIITTNVTITANFPMELQMVFHQ